MDTSDALTGTSLAALHYENSKLTTLTASYLAEIIHDYMGNQDLLQRATEAYRTYPGAPRIRLPRRWIRPAMLLTNALKRRRSNTAFRGGAIRLTDLAEILRGSYGITGSTHLRAAPSAGALYPIEIYPVCLKVVAVAPGFYHYHVREDALEQLGSNVVGVKQSVITHAQELECACFLILTAIWERTMVKYGERGYRFVMLEAGHVAQNLLLMATALRLRSCPIGGFLEDRLAADIKLDLEREGVVYVIAVGT